MRLSLRGKEIIINQLLSKLWYVVQIYTIPKDLKKETEKRIYNFLWNNKENSDSQTLRHSLEILDRHSIKFSKNKINSKIIKSHQCYQERSHVVLIKCWLIPNSNQGLALFRQKQILRYYWHKNNDDFFIQLLKIWLYFTNNKFLAPMSIEQILHQPIHLNPYTKLHFGSNNPCFYCTPSQKISDNYNWRAL